MSLLKDLVYDIHAQIDTLLAGQQRHTNSPFGGLSNIDSHRIGNQRVPNHAPPLSDSVTDQ